MSRILLVDDHPMVRTSLARILAHDGHSVVTAEDGIQASRLLESTAVDLVITDLVMPGMDGLELLRKIRLSGVRPPVIVLSCGGRGSGDLYLALALQMGADAALSKPVVLARLRDHVARLLRRKTPSGEPT